MLAATSAKVGCASCSRRRRPEGRGPRLWGCLATLAALLLALGAGGCAPSSQPTVVVVVSGVGSGAVSLLYSATLGGSAVRPTDSTQPAVTQELYPLPSGSSGNFSVDVRAVGSDGCALGLGHGEAILAGSDGERVTISVTLQPRSPALCPVSVSVNGSGSVSSDPTGISCGSQCQLDVAAGSSITLSASPSAKSNFVGWSGACSGVAPCTVQVLRPLSLGAAFSPQLCTTSGVCWESPLPGDVGLYGVWGATGSDVWAVGDFGQLLHYDGTSWTLASSPTNSNLRAIWGSSASNIWAVGLNGTILHYDGQSWSQSSAPGNPTATLLSVSGSGPSDVWIVGAAGVAFHFDGSAWSPSPTGLVIDLRGIVATATQQLAVAATGAIYRRTSGAWGLLGSNGVAAWGASAASDTSMVLVGDSGTLQTFDGSNLTKQPGYPGITSLFAVALRSPTDGWAVGTDGAVLRVSGGALSRLSSPTNQSLQAVYAFAANDVWAVGLHGTLLHFDGTQLVPYGSSGFPDGSDLRAVAALGSEQWAVGINNTILRNSGQGWVPLASGQPPTVSYRGVYVAAPNDVWIVGNNSATSSGVVLRWNGLAFSAVSPPPLTTQTLTAVAGSGPSNVWIGGQPGLMMRWNGSGFSAFSLPGAVSAPLINNIAAVSPTEVWFSCQPVTVTPPLRTIGCALRFDGTTLSFVPNIPAAAVLIGLFPTASNDVWFSGVNAGRGLALRVQSGMMTTSLDLGPTYGELDGIVDRSSSDIWLSGLGGVLLHSTDGMNFNRVSSGLLGNNLYALTPAGPSTLLAVGSGRAILRISQ